jgi:multicomponent Na+:H+ antiporter subunit G
MSIAGFAMAVIGVGLLVVAALGLFRLPDALSRQHAATKSATLALGLVLIGAALQVPDGGWWWRVGALLLFLVATLPVASHMLARAAARHTYGADALREVPVVGGDEEPRP